jgi:hypothetical protein
VRTAGRRSLYGNRRPGSQDQQPASEARTGKPSTKASTGKAAPEAGTAKPASEAATAKPASEATTAKPASEAATTEPAAHSSSAGKAASAPSKPASAKSSPAASKSAAPLRVGRCGGYHRPDEAGGCQKDHRFAHHGKLSSLANATALLWVVYKMVHEISYSRRESSESPST